MAWLGASLALGGTHSVAEADQIFTAPGDLVRVGGSVASAGAVDGDGLDDLLIGGYGDATGGEFACAVWLFLGSSLAAAPAGPLPMDAADAVFYGQEAGDSIGQYLCDGADVNDDGRNDLVLGAWKADGTLPDAGRVYVVLSPY